MAFRRNEDVFREWAGAAVVGGRCRRMRGGTVHVDDEGVLHYERRSHAERRPWGPVVLARYLPESKTILLNGDGFTDNSATNAQTNLRNLVRQMMSVPRRGTEVAERLAVIPHAALTAAQVSIDTISPLHVREDEMEHIYHPVAAPKFDQMKLQEKMSNDVREIYEGKVRGGPTVRYERRAVMGFRHIRTGRTATWLGYNERREEHLWEKVRTGWTDPNNAWTVFVPATETTLDAWVTITQFGTTALKQVASTRAGNNRRVLQGGWGNIEAGEVPDVGGWYRIEVVHHLGACLFRAVSADGKQHEFLSAFDEDEPEQMYFLAQLPDHSNAVNYQEALLALAPPLVHQARLEKRVVRRQGDVFAVATKLTDEQVYAMAKTRVRRGIAMVSTTVRAQKVLKEEVRERVDCSGGCGHKVWVGNGPKARRALMIYGTGHTATEVVVGPKGATYIRGVMHHDPGLQERGRVREHRDVALPPGWFLALRNTVPRQQTRRESPAAVTS